MSTADIAVRGAVSTPVLYRHFPSELDGFTGLPAQHDDLLAATLVGMARPRRGDHPVPHRGRTGRRGAVDLVGRPARHGVAGLVRDEVEYDT